MCVCVCVCVSDEENFCLGMHLKLRDAGLIKIEIWILKYLKRQTKISDHECLPFFLFSFLLYIFLSTAPVAYSFIC